MQAQIPLRIVHVRSGFAFSFPSTKALCYTSGKPNEQIHGSWGEQFLSISLPLSVFGPCLARVWCLENSDLETSDLENSDLETSDLETSDLENSDLETSDLETSDLESSDLENSDLENSDLETSDLETSDPLKNN